VTVVRTVVVVFPVLVDVVPAPALTPTGAVPGFVDVAVGHDSVTPRTGSFVGSDSDDSGVPAGTLKFRCSPPRTVTVSVQDCADAAAGRAARPTVVASRLATLTPVSRARLARRVRRETTRLYDP
jgi:hypothetical protein